mmetsp:Transcript_4825/g.7242  ORF Transcript_4825/g.7242 Transcript_4825/m.7242 type:complete len:264 (-) Transcript_4825:53-844(-)
MGVAVWRIALYIYVLSSSFVLQPAYSLLSTHRTTLKRAGIRNVHQMSASSEGIKSFLYHQDIAPLWQKSTFDHPFLAGCRDGSLSEKQFDTWLEQDYLFVKSFREFVRDGVLGSLPSEISQVHGPAIEGGLAALDDELQWFKSCAKARGLQNLDDVTALPPNLEYQKWMGSLIRSGDYSINAPAFWAIEAVYQVAWAEVLKGTSDKFSDFANRWGNQEFGEYVDLLEVQADSVLKDEEAVKKNMKQILILECGFWDMAFSEQN